MMTNKNSVLLLYTGGTIGMSENLCPMAFEQVQKLLPELEQTGVNITNFSFDPPIDSSDVDTDLWEKIARMIENNYDKFDGFVVLHGTDTMAYTASALSFMLENLAKPIILTGSQLRIGELRTDAKENLLNAIMLACGKNEFGEAMVPEVCVYFGDELYRGNRTTKKNAEHFSAFRSYNYPLLAKAGVHIKYFTSNIRYPDKSAKLCVRTKTDKNIAILKIFPGITQNAVSAVFSTTNLKAVVLESFGSGNVPQENTWFLNELKKAIDKKIIIVNKTQCNSGSVEMGRYPASQKLKDIGVISAYDCTTEAIVTKLMCLLGENKDLEKVNNLLKTDIAGEMTISDSE
ncbi:MAG: type I asparaginase [Paludibacter sp.]|nr:type I asparaginase [Paludibacter sp.]